MGDFCYCGGLDFVLAHRYCRYIVGVGVEDSARGLLSMVEAKNRKVPLFARASYDLVLRQNLRLQDAVQTNGLDIAGGCGGPGGRGVRKR